uniref:trypsin n=1 Tax=Myripristis murdjan TaxID=586833 RepID=A0A667WLT5_9TELE
MAVLKKNNSPQFTELSNEPLPGSCVSVRCQGYERSLAECVIYDPTEIESTATVATATCYMETQEEDNCEFKCVNKKCVSLEQTCDGVDDCGDRSDEMCCKKCRNDAFHCRTGVCVHKEAVRDGIVDCLDGKDESPVHTADRSETRANRQLLESQLYCGIPNSTTVDDEERVPGGRVKRVVGGVPTKPTQIQWQAAIMKYGELVCGGAYIGGCWVLTAAQCVRPKPSAFSVTLSLWKRRRPQDTTDVHPVHEIYIHPKYNAATYENDIALVENPAVSAVCVPWSPQLFQPNHTCSISGWGRTTAGGSSGGVLLWANVSLISNCQRFYKDRFKPGMMCAGDLKGNVYSSQGDSGAPLVCEDDQGLSYLWGIGSWGERSSFPGVYTQVNFITRDVPCNLRPRFCPCCL